jgi:hypothetical protein
MRNLSTPVRGRYADIASVPPASRWRPNMDGFASKMLAARFFYCPVLGAGIFPPSRMC